LECDATFFKQLQIIELVLCLGKTHKVDDQDMMVGKFFDASDLDYE
jgi:hypothetical protein